jgi:hypothetical protein
MRKIPITSQDDSEVLGFIEIPEAMEIRILSCWQNKIPITLTGSYNNSTQEILTINL